MAAASASSLPHNPLHRSVTEDDALSARSMRSSTTLISFLSSKSAVSPRDTTEEEGEGEEEGEDGERAKEPLQDDELDSMDKEVVQGEGLRYGTRIVEGCCRMIPFL